MVFGVISFGDVLNVVFYIFMGIILLILIGALMFRYRLNRLRKEAQRQAAGGAAYGTYSRGSRSRSGRREGEVTLERTEVTRARVVRSDIGDYVEYEEIEEEIKEEKTE